MERWLPIPEYEDLYEVSDLGRVRRLVDYANERPSKKPLIRKVQVSEDHPYPSVTLSRNGIKRRFTVHALVLNAFIGPCPDGMEAAHGDGDADNCILDNLRWATPQENNADKKRHGTQPLGEDVRFAKLRAQDIPEIRRRLAKGESQSSIAKGFGVCQTAIHYIHCGRNWKSIMA